MVPFGIIIVAYNPEVGTFYKKIEDYCKITDHVVVVNNGDSLLELSKICKVIDLGGNQGIAKAQNVGVNFLAEQKIPFVFLLDQDTKLNNEYFIEMIGEWRSLSERDSSLGALSPNIYDRNLKRELSISKLEPIEIKRIFMSDIEGDSLHNTLPISSGLLTKTSIFQEVGGNDAWMFIDWVDFKFDLDLISAGYSVYTTKRVIINHSVGKGVRHRFLWKVLNVSNHSPFREYYFYRNGIYFLRKDGKRFPQLRHYIHHALLTRSLFIFYEPQKITRIKRILKGISDGRRAR